MPELNKIGSSDLQRLRALQLELPAASIARVRQAWPLIGAALRAGHTLKTIHQRLIDDGVQIQYHTLARNVHRLRLEEAEKRGSISAGRRTSRSISSPRTSQAPLLPSDPLAQALEACARSSYNVTAAHCNGDPSKKKLI